MTEWQLCKLAGCGKNKKVLNPPGRFPALVRYRTASGHNVDGGQRDFWLPDNEELRVRFLSPDSCCLVETFTKPKSEDVSGLYLTETFPQLIQTCRISITDLLPVTWSPVPASPAAAQSCELNQSSLQSAACSNLRIGRIMKIFMCKHLLT